MKRVLVILSVVFLLGCSETTTYDLVILKGRVIDPDTGLDQQLNVGILGDTIASITEKDIQGNASIDASGLIVAPGFIDLHEHGINDETMALRVRDGVTTTFELEVGTNDVNGWYSERAPGMLINYGVSIGHMQVRKKVFGEEPGLTPSGPAVSEQASEEQIREMQSLIKEGLEQGAVGVGFGLAYTPAATTEEFEAMLRIAKEFGATSHIHLRNGLEGIKEAISSATKVGTPLHIVHINSSGGPLTAEYLLEVEKAAENGHDITTEAYPYEAGMTRIESALFDEWESWPDEKFGIHQWPETGEWLTRETFAKYRQTGGSIIIHERTEEMTATAINHPLTMIASDAFLSNGKGHPRTSGTYSRVLGRFVREKETLSLMDALAKMTIQPAKRLEGYVPTMRKKGRLQIGADADITIFSADKIMDQATYVEPTLPPLGIPFVIVSGQPVVSDGGLVTSVKPGKPIRN